MAGIAPFTPARLRVPNRNASPAIVPSTYPTRSSAGNGVDDLAVGFGAAAVLLSPALLLGNPGGGTTLVDPRVLGLGLGVGVLSSVVSVFFYLRIVVMMYMTERDARPVPLPVSRLAMAGLVVAMFGVLYLGVLPTRVIELAQQSIGTIF